MAGRRHGLDAKLILDDHGATRPLREAIAELVHDLSRSPSASAAPRSWTTCSPSRCRCQLRTAAQGGTDNGGDVRAVVDSLLAEMRAGIQGPS